jgi:hypothetical protein
MKSNKFFIVLYCVLTSFLFAQQESGLVPPLDSIDVNEKPNEEKRDPFKAPAIVSSSCQVQINALEKKTGLAKKASETLEKVDNKTLSSEAQLQLVQDITKKLTKLNDSIQKDKELAVRQGCPVTY